MIETVLSHDMHGAGYQGQFGADHDGADARDASGDPELLTRRSRIYGGVGTSVRNDWKGKAV